MESLDEVTRNANTGNRYGRLFFALGGVAINIKSKKLDNNQFIFAYDGEFRNFIQRPGLLNRCRRNADNEKPYGAWNQIELICFEDKSIHIVNGKVVMALQDSRVHIAENDEPDIGSPVGQ